MSAKTDKEKELTIQAMQRMPYYRHCVEKARENGIRTISATSIAQELGLGDVLVRKDIAAVSTRRGKPKAGFDVDALLEDIEHYMGFSEEKDAIIAGAGSLGRALMGNQEFEEYGLRIVAAFDVQKELIGHRISGVPIYCTEELEEFCQEREIRIGIITTPPEAAQETANAMIRGGVLAIWNFALVNLEVPEGVLVQNENLASSLAMLSHHIMR